MGRHFLVLEPDARGHAEEWLLHILRLVRDESPDVRVTFAVPDSLALRLAAEARGHANLDILPLDETETARCLQSNLALAAFARWQVMRRCMDRTGADEALFMCIDGLSLPFALGLGLGEGRRASGILFRPSVHYGAFARTEATLGERIRDWRKHVLYPLMLKNPAVATVHSLDPYFPEYARARYVGGAKVVELPDPIADTREPYGERLRVPRAPRDRVAFLLFGELTQRKGILQLLEACARLDAGMTKKIAILLAGRVDPSLESKVDALVRAARSAQPDLWIEVDNRRLSFAELTAAVDACDVVLAPYQRFVGSSGVLIWAARALRPVITQRYALLGRLVRDFRLGLDIDTTSPDAIAEGIEHAIRLGAKTLMDPHRARLFLAGRDARAFAQRLLGLAHSDGALTDSRARLTSSG